MANIDLETVAGFGEQWSRCDQNVLSNDYVDLFQRYFHIFRWNCLAAKQIRDMMEDAAPQDQLDRALLDCGPRQVSAADCCSLVCATMGR